jgi:O-antigen/teichoic acid export membrane protein
MQPAVSMAPAPDPKPVLVRRAVEPHRLAINFLFLSGGECTAKLLTFASFSYLARTLGPWQYGLLEFTLAVMVFFTLPVDWGLGIYGAREIARQPKSAPRFLREITGLRLLLSLCSMLALGVFILVIHKSTELKMLLALYGLSLLGGPFLLQWFFQAHDQMQWVGLASVIRQASFAGLVFLFCRGKASIVTIGMIECGSVISVGVFCLYVARYRMRLATFWPELRMGRLLPHFREAFPIGLTELAWAFMWYFCTVLLGFVFADVSLGWFGASHRALMALHTFVWLYFFNLLPSISRCVERPLPELLHLMKRSIRFAAWTGLLAVGMLSAFAPLLLTVIYGPAFRAATSSFTVLAWMLPVAMLSGHHRYILVAYNRQGTLFACTAASAAAAVALGFLLVPVYGGVGAAWALLIANVANFILVYFAVRRLIAEVPVHRELAGPLLACLVSLVIYRALSGWNPWFAMSASLAWYMGCLVRMAGSEFVGLLQSTFRKAAVRNV